MELQFISFPFLLCVILVFPILMVLKMGKRSNSNLNLPPGPRKLPFIGNLHQLVGSLPHHKLRDLSLKYGSLTHIQLGEVSSVVVSSPEIAREVMNKHDITFASRPPLLAWKILSYGCKNIAFSPYGEYWRQLRKISTLELLSARRVQSFRWIREEELTDFVMWISSNVGSPINLTENIFSLGYTITSRVAFGKKSKDQERFISIVKEATTLAGGFSVGDVFPSSKWLHVISGMRPKLERMHREADRILNAIVEDHLQNSKHKSEGSEDLVDVLLKFVEHDDLGFSLTLDNVKAVIFGIFTAGSETSATTVDWAMAEMMQNPTILNKAQSEVRRVFNKRGKVEEDGLQELKYLQLVIKETLRLHPPLPLLLPRVSGERCEIGCFEIPINTKVIVNAWAIGRDTKYWKEAEKFNPDRFMEVQVDFKGTNFEYLPFGAGRRMCPGVVFGLNSMEYQLAVLLHNFDWKVPNGGLNMTEAFGVTVRRKDDLYLVPSPYQQQTSSS